MGSGVEELRIRSLGGFSGLLPNWGGGTGCPVGTKNIVGVTWVGGVTKPGGGEVTDKERQQYKISVKQLDDEMIEAIPFAIADLNDGDNNHKLCLDCRISRILCHPIS